MIYLCWLARPWCREIGVITRLQTVCAEGAEEHKGVSSTRGKLGLELQALVNTVEASLDEEEKDKVTQLLAQHWVVFHLTTQGEPPGRTKLVQHYIFVENTLPIKQREQWLHPSEGTGTGKILTVC